MIAKSKTMKYVLHVKNKNTYSINDLTPHSKVGDVKGQRIYSVGLKAMRQERVSAIQNYQCFR